MDRLPDPGVPATPLAAPAFREIAGPAGRLSLRHRPAQPGLQPREPILFVHGATLASDLYDVPYPGASWMAAAAAAGRDAYAVDLRGYGRSERPAHFDAPPERHPPYARAAEVVRDIDAAVEAIRAETGRTRIDLVGGSWGSITCARYAGTLGREKVARLILFAPIHAEWNEGWLAICGAPGDPATPNPDLGAYRWVGEAGVRRRWDAEIPVGDKTLWRPEPLFRALIDSALSADPAAETRSPPAFRVPNGTLLDLHGAFSGVPQYEAGAIAAPTLLIRGDADPTSTAGDMARLYAALRTPVRHAATVAGASHFAVAERAGPQVFAIAEGFLSSV